jgi:alpha-L-fucosidase
VCSSDLGYFRDEKTWRSTETLVKTLVDSVSKGGNLILNVGPTARGEFDDRALDRLKGMGEWMKRHKSSIYGCTQAPEEFPCPPDCRYTYNPETNRLYLHLFSWSMNVFLKNMENKIQYAQLLNDASEVTIHEKSQYDYSQTGDGEIVLELPIMKPNAVVPVIEIFLKK